MLVSGMKKYMKNRKIVKRKGSNTVWSSIFHNLDKLLLIITLKEFEEVKAHMKQSVKTFI